MTIKLQLDSAALEALFPEGSDARVELQSCVQDAMVRRIAKGKFYQMADGMIGKLVNEAVVDEVNTYQPKLTVRARDMIDKYISDAVYARVREAERAMMTSTDMEARITAEVGRQADRFSNSLLTTEIQRYIDRKLGSMKIAI